MQAVAAAAVKQLWRAQRHAHCHVDDFYYYMRRRKFPSFMTWSMIVCVGWMKMNFSRYYFGVGKSLSTELIGLRRLRQGWSLCSPSMSLI